MYIDGRPLLHVVDESTKFGAARWVQSMSAQHVWEALRTCWIDVYLGPPDVIAHDAGKNFVSHEFRQNATALAIETKEVPVEAHNSIGIVERYHGPLRRAYDIIHNELKGADKNMLLQMAIKAVNDTAGPDGLVPTLLVFGAYPKISPLDLPAPTISQRAQAIKTAMSEVRRYHVHRQVTDALRMRNGPNVSQLAKLPLNSLVLVWREKDKWTGPYRLINIDGQTCTVETNHGPVKFRSTVVKPNYPEGNDIPSTEQNVRPYNQLIDETQPRYPTRLRTQTLRAREAQQSNQFISLKESNDLKLSQELRSKGVITTPGKPFELSRRKEIDGLIARQVFKFLSYDQNTMQGIRLFRSRFVDEIKGKQKF
ncbi:hypothetical protein K3495_g10103 [Podosphaera aphanis]|nr:hypothetical protein K3495_g10103 [Podosphaera aphanis]